MTESNQKVRILVGMPVYNGEAFLARALESLLRQSYTGWRLLIADNCSVDGSGEIAREYASRDPRISYLRHESNLGAVSNFCYLANAQRPEFFMWAAADDEWSENFIEACIKSLDQHPEVQFVGGNVVNIDPKGEALRTCAGFGRFGASQVRRLARFLSEPEINGKANMIYSVYRGDFCRELLSIPNIFSGWGADMAFVFAALARGNYRHVPGISLYKRVCSASDIVTTRLAAAGRFSELQFFGCFPPDRYREYLGAYYSAAPGRRLRLLIWIVLTCRMVSLRCRLKLAGANSRVARLVRS